MGNVGGGGGVPVRPLRHAYIYEAFRSAGGGGGGGERSLSTVAFSGLGRR